MPAGAGAVSSPRRRAPAGVARPPDAAPAAAHHTAGDVLRRDQPPHQAPHRARTAAPESTGLEHLFTFCK